MISAKDLSDEQKAAIEQWAADGAQLSDIQKRLQNDLGFNVTYMDTRFLVLDLGIEIQGEVPDGPEETDDAEPAPDSSPLDATAPNPAGGVSVTSDEICRPGALVSGRVTFSDGEVATWMIDQMGRLALDASTPGYQPSEADAMQFETELRRLLES